MEDIVHRNILLVPEGAIFCLLPDLRVVYRIIKKTHLLYKFTVF